ncbi:MAG: hypothetical protein UT26_C0057G0004 [Microgenomates group bacterium GW2011_GWC1_39_12]|nr:MAG: hypothetical protein UT26_C0057G0004 [Microgenomates group bacterium GW2011_GWC1_39_12]
MEQHPVPQNVTTFQFRLIGDMTIKQFGYLAGGALLAFISYKLPLPFFFTWPATVLFGLLGFGFAFVPIEERPMDVWVLSFLKNVYSPTQFIWHRIPAASEPKGPQIPPAVTNPAPTSVSPTAVSPHPATPPPTVSQRPAVSEKLRGLYTQQPVAQKKQSFWDSLFGWLDDLFPKSTAVTRPIIQPALSVSSTAQQQIPQTQLSSEYLDLQNKIKTLEQQLEDKTKTELKTLELQKQMTDTVKQKQYMEEELVKLRKQPARVPNFTPSTRVNQAVPQVKPRGPTVKIIPPEATTRAGLPRLTTFSNVVTGIVKDNVGGLLPGVLVTVRDKEGVPLRALKTNKLGQFAASTQLPNGTYIIEVEDPRNRYLFDRAQITLNGAVMPAIEIVAKSKRDINREELSKQIFGQTVNS